MILYTEKIKFYLQDISKNLKTMRTLYLIFTFFIFSSVVYSQGNKISIDNAIELLNQSKLDKANKLYNGFAYFEAAKIYEELASQKYDANKFSHKLGDCYFNIGKTEKSEIWYEKAVANDSIDVIYYYKYAQALRCNKKYSEADKWFEKYQLKRAEDKTASKYLSDKNYINKIKSQKSFFTVTNFSELNSEFSDFGAVNYGKKIAFATARDLNMIIKNSYAWNEEPFLEIMVYDSLADVKSKYYSISNDINTKFHEGALCFDSTGTIMYFTRNNYYKGQRVNSDKGINNLMLFKATYKDSKWTEITPLPFNNKDYSVGHPCLSSDNKKLFFASDMPGGFGGTDIYYVDITADGYGNPINLGPEINTERNEMFPFANEYNLYFSSEGHIGLGGLDIFYARFSPDGKFKNVTNLGIPVNSSMDDFCFVLNKDNQTGYLASNREGGKGNDDIYKITSDFIQIITVKANVKDSTDNSIIENANVVVKNEQGETIYESTTDENGKFNFIADYGQNYKIIITKDSYPAVEKSISTVGVKSAVLQANIKMLKQLPIALVGVIKDKYTGELLENVSVIIKNKPSQEKVIDILTTANGDFYKELAESKPNDLLDYEVILKKEGYLTKNIDYNYLIKDYGIINMNEKLDINLDKIAVGTDIGKLLNINPIYFDLNKSNIRPDAAVELDKIVKVMKENPTMVVELGSHTDCRASAKYNLDLSDRRAKSSAEYIRNKGIEKDRIYGKGYGESKLVNNCACEGNVKSDCSEEEHQLNRRTEFIIVKM